MDIAGLATQLTVFLAPLLPYLFGQTAEYATQEALKKIVPEVWDEGVQLWKRLWPTVQERPAAIEALAEVIANPADVDNQTVLRKQFERMLTANPTLSKEIGLILARPVVQRVIAKSGSIVRKVKQDAQGLGETTQEVIADEQSTIEDVDQQRR